MILLPHPSGPARVLLYFYSSDDDIIYVQNAQRLTQPDPVAGVFGVVTIDGERIMYRERNLANNTISSLLRGTAGTAAAAQAQRGPRRREARRCRCASQSRPHRRGRLTSR